ncbi:MAG: hypothetical protein ACM3Y9_14340, partial [Ignavibacteria bacterium]
MTRQAAIRLVVSISLFILLLGSSSFKIYSIALEKSSRERAEDVAAFYRTRLMQLERDWELQARDFKVRIEVTRLLENPRTRVVNLDAFMTVQGTARRFAYLLIQKASGEKLFSFGTALDLPIIPLADQREAGWYRDGKGGPLYRVFVVPIWLGEAGTGRMAVFYEVDNALLFNLATPGILLQAKYRDDAVASSIGQAGLQGKASPARETEVREIPWSTDPGEPTALRIVAPFKALFSRAELVGAAIVIPLIDGL